MGKEHKRYRGVRGDLSLVVSGVSDVAGQSKKLI